MTDYEIRPPTLRCALTGRELRPGDEYWSVLTETTDGFARSDFAADSWVAPPADAFGFWRSRVPATAGRNVPKFVDDCVLVDLFERLEGDTDQQKLRFRFILALLLVRKKVLKFDRNELDGGHEFLLVRSASTGTLHRVFNPGLSESELVAVQAEVERLLMAPTE